MSLLESWEGEPAEAWARRWNVPRVELHARIGSTNDRVRALAAEGGAPWTVVVAEEQTRGRGRSGDPWHSPPGSGLWLSTLLPGEPEPCLPLRVGLAAARAVEEASGAAVGIKWPNDLLMDGRKVGGILCEGTRHGVVAGVGINVRTPEGGFPEALRAVATSAEAEAGRPVSRGAVATALLAGLRTLAAGGRGGALDAAEREALARRDVLAGRAVRTEAGEGVARGVDADGALLVEGPDGGRFRVVAGSVRLA